MEPKNSPEQTDRKRVVYVPQDGQAGLSRLLVGFLWLFSVGVATYVYVDLRRVPAGGRSSSSSSRSAGLSATSSPAEARVNHYLQELNLRLETQKYLTRDDLEKARQEINHQLAEETSRQQKAPKNSLLGTSSSTMPGGALVDRHEKLAERDLYVPQAHFDPSPSAEIQRDLAREKEVTQARQSLNEAYVSQFIENARKSGYDIDVDDHFQVTNIRKRNGVGTTGAH